MDKEIDWTGRRGEAKNGGDAVGCAWGQKKTETVKKRVRGGPILNNRETRDGERKKRKNWKSEK